MIVALQFMLEFSKKKTIMHKPTDANRMKLLAFLKHTSINLNHGL